MKIEVRSDHVLISGYVNAVGRDSRPLPSPTGKFVEMVEPGVFRAALERAQDVQLLLNHDKNRVLGSTKQGNLKLWEDNIGLRAECKVYDADVIEKARKGELRGWSFGMYVNNADMEERADNIPRRHLRDIDIFEVSLIDKSKLPCYAGTSVECRADSEIMAETRSVDDEAEIKCLIPPDLSDYERRLNDIYLRAYERRLAELRYNPYHDPTNGRFTSGSGGGNYLFVGKGQKGKGQYVFERDVDAEYEKWKADKAVEKSSSKTEDIYSQKFASADDYKKALAEKYHGITSVDKVKTAKDVSDFINYDTQSQYYASTGSSHNKAIQSTWKKGVHGINTNEFGFGDEVSPVQDSGFSDKGTTILEMPKGYSSFKNNTHVFDASIAKLEKAGIGVGHWHDDTYMITKKKGVRTSKWLEGLRAFDTDDESG
ncbi:MAG: HK97 family phage prohead protease [Oscillospiraceae bacterium]